MIAQGRWWRSTPTTGRCWLSPAARVRPNLFVDGIDSANWDLLQQLARQALAQLAARCAIRRARPFKPPSMALARSTPAARRPEQAIQRSRAISCSAGTASRRQGGRAWFGGHGQVHRRRPLRHLLLRAGDATWASTPSRARWRPWLRRAHRGSTSRGEVTGACRAGVEKALFSAGWSSRSGIRRPSRSASAGTTTPTRRCSWRMPRDHRRRWHGEDTPRLVKSDARGPHRTGARWCWVTPRSTASEQPERLPIDPRAPRGGEGWPGRRAGRGTARAHSRAPPT